MTTAATARPAGSSGRVVSTWRPSWPCEPAAILGPLRRGAGDPAFRSAGDGTVWRALPAPTGPATLRLTPRRSLGEIDVEAWGPGAEWAVDSVPGLLGAADDVSGFSPVHPTVRALTSLDPHWRVMRTGLVLESLVAAAIEQKVTGQEARLGWRLLLRRFGSVAPGPAGEWGMHCCPDAAQLRAIASWQWLQCHIDGARSAPIVRAARSASAIERLAGLTPQEADARLRSIPGIGVWTSAEIRQRAIGDTDAVSFGDYHIATHVGVALTGQRIDDAELARLLEPERPHRYRVQHLVTSLLPGAPRHGPRMAPRTHLPR
jgi:3-methyladenine DNA glycosylase/8-oxoguanine DNA glycosylase